MLSNVEAGINLEHEKLMRVWWKSTRGNENVPRNVNISRNQPQNLIVDINVSAALDGNQSGTYLPKKSTTASFFVPAKTHSG